jgi:bacterioferritin
VRRRVGGETGGLGLLPSSSLDKVATTRIVTLLADLIERRRRMKGNQEIIELLNQLLTNELTAINQYFAHAKICENWGLAALAKKIRDESIDEMRHAERVIDRILYLEGMPNLQRLGKVNVGQNVREQLELDLALEHAGIKFLNDGIELARTRGDHGSFELLSEILKDEEVHTDWLETQLDLIERIGEQHYLAQQVRG